MRAAAPNDGPELADVARADAALADAELADAAPANIALAAAVAPTPQATAAASATAAADATLATRAAWCQLAGILIPLPPPKLLPLISYKAMLPTARDGDKGRTPHLGSPPQLGACRLTSATAFAYGPGSRN